MKFQELEVNQNKYGGTSFREVSLILNRSSNSSGKDWFDTTRYIRDKLPKLRAIRPPTFTSIRCTVIKTSDNVIDLEHDKPIVRTEEFKKQRLVPELPKFQINYKVKIDVWN